MKAKPGALTILAKGADGSLASVPVAITSAAIEPAAPSTTLVAAVAVTGEKTDMWASGFKPNEVVTIKVAGRIVMGRPANEYGALMIEVPISVAPGIYTAEATGDRGSVATAPLVVVEEK